MLMPTLSALVFWSSPGWTGEFTLTIRGEGNATGPGPSKGTWKVDRVARGTIQLTKTFKGAGIARTPDSGNTGRYETWIAEARTPARIEIRDVITVFGPLFAKNEVRLDTYRYACPVPPSPITEMNGKTGSAILQFDLQKGTYEFESPRIYATVDRYFERKFVSGPKRWTNQKPIVQKGPELEFEVIHGLNQPKEWFKMVGPYKPGQSEIVLTRRLPFTVPLGVSLKPGSLTSTWTIVLRKSE